MTNKIGIFSGTFDPIHIGHVEVCLVAKGALELDEVLVFIEKNPTRKAGVADYKHRLKMAELALQDFGTIKVIDKGVDNITLKSTQKFLDKNYPKSKTFLIVGSDMVKHLEHWEDIEDILNAMELVVFLRDTKEEKTITQQLERLSKKYELTFHVLPPVWSQVSSSIVKNELKKGGSGLIHKDVHQYIKNKKLYTR